VSAGSTPPAPGVEPSPASAAVAAGERQGLSFEALFYRQLQQVTARIHDTEDVEQIMRDVSPEICRLFNADRLTLYAMAEDLNAIVS